MKKSAEASTILWSLLPVAEAYWLLASVTPPETAFVHLLIAPQARPLYSLTLVPPFFFAGLK
jgi:hypothetical protein